MRCGQQISILPAYIIPINHLYWRATMHAVVAIPPVRDFYFTPHRFANLGAAVVSNILHNTGHTVRLFNFPLGEKTLRRLPLPAELAHLRPFLLPAETGPLRFFGTYKRFGPDFVECAARIKAVRPDLVFVSCFAFAYAADCLELAAAVKKVLPGVPVIAGGAGVSAHPRYFLTSGPIDFCLCGEAEITLSRFLILYAGGASVEEYLCLPNLFLKRNGAVYSSGKSAFTKDTDLGFTLKKCFETRYTLYYSLCLSRGCSKQCRFCSLHLCHGRGFRKVALGKIISGIKTMAPGMKSSGKQIRINFEDDNLLLAPEYFIEVLKILGRYLPQVEFYAENGLDYTLLTPALLERLIQSGFRQFNLSLGTFSKTAAGREQRTLLPAHYNELAGIIRKHGLACITYFICGLKGDTREGIAQTLAFLAARPTQVGISFFYAVPGLPDFNDTSRFDTCPPELCKGSAAYPWNGSLSTESLVTAFRLSRFINLLKAVMEIPTDRASAYKPLIDLIIKEKRLFTLIKTKNGPRPSPVTPIDDELAAAFFRRLH